MQQQSGISGIFGVSVSRPSQPQRADRVELWILPISLMFAKWTDAKNHTQLKSHIIPFCHQAALSFIPVLKSSCLATGLIYLIFKCLKVETNRNHP